MLPTPLPPLARFALLPGLVVLAPLATPQAHPEDAAPLVASARSALGWDSLPGTRRMVTVRGEAALLGTEAVQTIRFDGAGRFEQTFEGPLPLAGGFDGERVWSVDWTGVPRVLELGDRTDAELAMWFLSGAWTRPGTGLSFELRESGAGERALHFVHPDGFAEGDLRLDAETLLPIELRYGKGEDLAVWTYSDWREEGGVRFPGRLAIAQGGLDQGLTTGSIAVTEPDGAAADAAFRARLEQPRDTRFDADVPAGIEVRRVMSGQMLVHPTVDGEDLGWFIFDTGAGINCISTHVADQLPEGPFGNILAQGVGGTVPSRFWRADELTLGPVTIDAPLFMGLDLAFLKSYFGVEVAGILGYELLARCAIELDPSEPAIALHDPATYELPEAGTWAAAKLYGKIPCVRGAFEGKQGLFKIDTGASGAVMLYHRAVVDHGLLEGRETVSSLSGGVGGSIKTREGVLETFEFGGKPFEAVPASFIVEDRGAFADEYVEGTVGVEILRSFVLVFDYPRERVGFVPRD